MQGLCAVVFVLCLSYVFCACPGGWKEWGNHCYHFEEDHEVWAAAKAMCQWHGGELLKIESAAEQAWFVQQAHSFNHTGDDEGFWLDATDLIQEGVWVWESARNKSAALLSAGYQTWGKDQPNNREGREDCLAAVLYFDYVWSDEYCDGLHLQYVCEKSATANPIVG